MKNLKTAPLDQLNNFCDVADPLYDFIKNNWEGDILPKGYKKFLKDYEDYAGMEELNVAALQEEFKGYNDTTVGSPCFPVKISLPHVAYNDTNQSVNPLRSLIYACVGHGLIIGKKRGELTALKNIERLERDAEFGIESIKESIKFFKDFGHM